MVAIYSLTKNIGQWCRSNIHFAEGTTRQLLLELIGFPRVAHDSGVLVRVDTERTNYRRSSDTLSYNFDRKTVRVGSNALLRLRTLVHLPGRTGRCMSLLYSFLVGTDLHAWLALSYIFVNSYIIIALIIIVIIGCIFLLDYSSRLFF